MRIVTTLLMTAIAFAPTGARAECRPSDEIVRVRISLEPAKNVHLAGLVLAVTYPADRLVIPGQGQDAGRSALVEVPEGAFTMSEDRDGELRLVVAKAEALKLDPLCEITFHRCEGAESAKFEEVSCRVTDASDPTTNKIKDVRCSVDAAS